MEHMISPDILPKRVLESLTSLCARYQVRKLAIFGSVTGPGFNPDTSDIDILVDFEKMSPVQHMENYFSLSEALEGLFGRRVDLVESSAVRNPFIRASIEKTRIDLFAAA